MWVAGLSTVVEWYDFTLYLYFATVLSRVFFGGGEQALLVTLAGFAVSYLMRPLGALCFGHLGDRLGPGRHTRSRMPARARQRESRRIHPRLSRKPPQPEQDPSCDETAG